MDRGTRWDRLLQSMSRICSIGHRKIQNIWGFPKTIVWECQAREQHNMTLAFQRYRNICPDKHLSGNICPDMCPETFVRKHYHDRYRSIGPETRQAPQEPNPPASRRPPSKFLSLSLALSLSLGRSLRQRARGMVARALSPQVTLSVVRWGTTRRGAPRALPRGWTPVARTRTFFPP